MWGEGGYPDVPNPLYRGVARVCQSSKVVPRFGWKLTKKPLPTSDYFWMVSKGFQPLMWTVYVYTKVDMYTNPHLWRGISHLTPFTNVYVYTNPHLWRGISHLTPFTNVYMYTNPHLWRGISHLTPFTNVYVYTN